MRLTEEVLARNLDDHRENCDACSERCADCGSFHSCEEVDRIEASFWNEVDRQIDEMKENRGSRFRRY